MSFQIVRNDITSMQVDAIVNTVQVENKNGELIDMSATRCWLITLIDTATRAIIGYSLSQYEDYNQTDVLNAIHNSIVTHKKMVVFHH